MIFTVHIKHIRQTSPKLLHHKRSICKYVPFDIKLNVNENQKNLISYMPILEVLSEILKI